MIDYEQLLNALKNTLLEENWGKYDLESIVHNAVYCWDGTAIMVKSNDFKFIFDSISYECKSVSTNDLIEEMI